MIVAFYLDDVPAAILSLCLFCHKMTSFCYQVSFITLATGFTLGCLWFQLGTHTELKTEEIEKIIN